MEPLLSSASRLFASARPKVIRQSIQAPFICPQCSQQIRGKKTKRGPKAIIVRLQQDITGYGKQGSIIPVPIGQFRNWLHPGGMAVYVSQEQQKTLKRTGATIERDTLFGREDRPVDSETSRDIKIKYKPEPRQVDLNMLSPEKAHALLENVVPPVLIYHRAPIAPAAERAAAPSPANPAQVAAPPPDATPRQSPENIFGSVSPADITASIKALLHQQALSGLVVLPDEQIRFTDVGGEGSGVTADRIKALGEFDYEIRVQGYETPIRRAIRVVPEDVEPEVRGPNYEGSGIEPPQGGALEERAESIGI